MTFLGFGFCFFIPVVVLTILALSRASSAATSVLTLQRELAALTMRLMALERQLHERQRTSKHAIITEEPAATAFPVESVEPAVSPRAATEPNAPERIATPPVVPQLPVDAVAPAVAPQASPVAQPVASVVDWEKWLGVRGAAVLGGIALALAGVLFFRYSIEHGLIPPEMRVIGGTLLGLGCLAGGARLRDRYPAGASALSGGGVVVLYAAFWAARALYGLIPMPVSFALMALTTAAACVMAVRSGSTLVAFLGLAGGFLTPVLLSTGGNQPLGLFGYTLLLDLGVLIVSLRLKRAWLAVLGLLGTVLLQIGWMTSRMEPHQFTLAVSVLGLFALLFAVLAGRGQERSVLWRATRVAAIGIPVFLAVPLLMRVDFGPQVLPLIGLFVCLALGAGYLGRSDESLRPWLLALMAGAQLVVLAIWGFQQETFAQEVQWQFFGGAVALIASYAAFSERPLVSEPGQGQALAGLIFSSGAFWLSITLIRVHAAEWAVAPVIAFWVISLGFVVRALHQWRKFEAMPTAAGLASFGVALALPALGASTQEAAWSNAATLFGLPLLLAALLHGSAFRGRFQGARQSRALAASTVSVVALIMTVTLPTQGLAAAHFLLGVGLLTAMSAFASAAPRISGRAWGASVLALSFACNAYVVTHKVPEAEALVSLVLVLALGVASTLWSSVLGKKALEDKTHTAAAALVLPLLFFPSQHLFRIALGTEWLGALPLGLGAIMLGVLVLHRRVTLSAEAAKRHTVFLAAMAIGFLAVAIPLQLERQWITLGWALMGAGLIWLWRRLDHEGLKWAAATLFLLVSTRLLLNGAVLAYQPSSGTPVFNWLMYTYLVPALAMGVSVRLLGPLERARLRPWEQGLYSPSFEWVKSGVGLAALLVIFAWLNLTVFDAFSESGRLEIRFDRNPARDLTVSLVWALYAIALLAAGMWKKSKALRWMSLIFLLMTIAKVFLGDLGNLKDLYRVMSLLGLAASLIVVSLAYQRFVFKPTQPPSDRSQESP